MQENEVTIPESVLHQVKRLKDHYLALLKLRQHKALKKEILMSQVLEPRDEALKLLMNLGLTENDALRIWLEVLNDHKN